MENQTYQLVDPYPALVSNPDPYEVRIVKAENGFIVSVGCKSFVFENLERMMECIKAYLTNPTEVSRSWLQDKVLPA